MFNKYVMPSVFLVATLFASAPTVALDFDEARFDRGNILTFGTATNVEERAEVYYPVDSGGIPTGPHPLIIILHGRHAWCYNPTTGATSTSWPCSSGYQPIPSYRGYRYIGQELASQGYIVASISAAGIDAAACAYGCIPERARLIEHHLDLWHQFNTTGGGASYPAPFANGFIGKVDLSNVGTLGHSRGGGGVVEHAYTIAPTSPYTLRAAYTLAPTNNTQRALSGVPFATMLAYCDGDVYDMQGLVYFDDARYADPGDTTPKFTFFEQGSNHNFFNGVWTPECWTDQLGPDACWDGTLQTMPSATVDDWMYSWYANPNDIHCTQTSAARLSPADQRSLGLTYISAFFRRYMGNELDFGPLLRGDIPPSNPSFADSTFVGYQPPADQRLELNRIAEAAELTETTLVNSGGVHGAVTNAALDEYERCGWDFTSNCFPGATRLVAHSLGTRGLSRLRVGWSGFNGTYSNELPPGTRDISRYSVLQFRAAVDYTGVTTASPVEFTVTLHSGAGSAQVTTAGQTGNDPLFIPPGEYSAAMTVMNTVRIRLDNFGDAAFLSDIQSVEFRFENDTPGTVMVSDIMFAAEACDPDRTPPVIADVPDQQVTSCDLSGGEIELTVPTAADDCVDDVPVTGAVIASNAGAVGTPVVGNTISLPPGTHTIRWTADDGTNTAFVDQVIVVAPGLLAGERLIIENGATVNAAASAGTTTTYIGIEAEVGDIWSIPNVYIDHRAAINGTVRSTQSINLGIGVDLTNGTLQPFSSMVLPGVPTLNDVIFPPPTGDQYVWIGLGETLSLSPGSYYNVAINYGGTLVLSPGDYYFSSLTINADTSIIISPLGDVRIYVQNTLAVRSSFTDDADNLAPIYIGYKGTNPVTLEAPVWGSVIAPNATMEMGTGNALNFSGEFMARTLRIRPGITVTCESMTSPEPPDPDCSDGIQNQNETDIDCGGVCGATCEVGQECDLDDDCVSDYCEDGLCQPQPVGCTENTAVDLGSDGQATTIINNGCVMVRDHYPSWWGTRTMLLQNLSPGTYPVPFIWSNTCSGSSGAGVYTGDWQSKFLSTTNAGCATVIDLQGSGSGTISIRYYGT